MVNKLKLRFAFCLMIMSTTIEMIAQPDYDQNLGYVPHFRHVRDVELYNNKLFAVGGWEYNDSIASIFYSTDEGVNWNYVTDNINAIIEDIDFVGSTGLAVGWSGNFWRSENGGIDWVSIPMLGILSNRDFLDAFWLDANTGFVVGGKIFSADTLTTIAKTVDGGQNWQLIFEESGSRLNSIVFYDNMNAISVGDNGLILRTQNGGMSWTHDELLGIVSDWEEIQVSFQSELTGIVGGVSGADSLQTILISSDAGLNWQIVQNGTGSKWMGMDWVLPMTACVVGEDGAKMWSEDGGATWSTFLLSSDNDIQWNEVQFLTPGKAILGGEFGKVMTITDPVNLVSGPEVRDVSFHYESQQNALIISANDDLEQFYVSIFDVAGKLVIGQRLERNVQQIDLQTISSGNYFVQLSGNCGVLNYHFIKP
jgi:photosystem II stability/assembly factor-like uncharacterized protein